MQKILTFFIFISCLHPFVNSYARTVNFEYGVYEGSVNVDIYVKGKDISTRNQFQQELNPNFIIDCNKYEDLTLEVKYSNIKWAKKNHDKNFILSVSPETHFSKEINGFVLADRNSLCLSHQDVDNKLNCNEHLSLSVTYKFDKSTYEYNKEGRIKMGFTLYFITKGKATKYRKDILKNNNFYQVYKITCSDDKEVNKKTKTKQKEQEDKLINDVVQEQKVEVVYEKKDLIKPVSSNRLSKEAILYNDIISRANQVELKHLDKEEIIDKCKLFKQSFPRSKYYLSILHTWITLSKTKDIPALANEFQRLCDANPKNCVEKHRVDVEARIRAYRSNEQAIVDKTKEQSPRINKKKNTEDRNWEAATKTGSSEAFFEYAQKYPKGKYIAKAEDKTFEIIKTNIKPHYENYIKCFPEGKHRVQVECLQHTEPRLQYKEMADGWFEVQLLGNCLQTPFSIIIDSLSQKDVIIETIDDKQKFKTHIPDYLKEVQFVVALPGQDTVKLNLGTNYNFKGKIELIDKKIKIKEILGGKPPYFLQLFNIDKVILDTFYIEKQDTSLTLKSLFKEKEKGNYTISLLDSGSAKVAGEILYINAPASAWSFLRLLFALPILIFALFILYKKMFINKKRKEEDIDYETIYQKEDKNVDDEMVSTSPLVSEEMQVVSEQNSNDYKDVKNFVSGTLDEIAPKQKKKRDTGELRKKIRITKVVTQEELNELDNESPKENYSPSSAPKTKIKRTLLSHDKQKDYYEFALDDLWDNTSIDKVYMHKVCIARIEDFVFVENSLRQTTNMEIPEIGGFLLGTYQLDKKTNQYNLFLERFINIQPQYNGVYQIAFGSEAWNTLNTYLNAYDDLEYKLIGWFHTHPGHGLFLSNDDLKIHENFFKEPFHIAMELDSVKRLTNPGYNISFFSRKMNGKINNHPEYKGKWFQWTEVVEWVKSRKDEPEKNR